MAVFDLPSRLPTYRLRLYHHYSRSGERLLRDVIRRSYVDVVEGTVSDRWNGGTYGHDVHFYLPIEELTKVNIDDIEAFTARIREDLNKVCDRGKNEFFSTVHLQLYDEADEHCRRAKPFRDSPDRDPDTLSIWKRGMVRLFISHRDEHKAKANELARALEPYGISSFVAHDTIEPMTRWQTEILSGLETMETMLAFITDDFHESVWVNQEIGFALGRGIPIVSLKIQKSDPHGFIGSQQALKCNFDNIGTAAPTIYGLIVEKLDNAERLQQSLIRSFVASPNFIESIERFDRMNAVVSNLSDSEVQQIVNGYRDNDQLHNAAYLRSRYGRLCKFLNRVSGKTFVVERKNLVTVGDSEELDVPF